MVFSFNAKKLNTKKDIIVPSSLRTLSDFLEYLRAERKLTVKVIENYVLISIPSIHDKLRRVAGMQNAATPRIGNNLTAIEIRRLASQRDSVKISSQDSVRINTLQQAILNKPIDTLKTLLVQNTSVSHNILPDTLNLKSPQIDSGKPEAKPVDEQRKDSVLKSPPVLSSRRELFLRSGVTLDESSFMGIVTHVGFTALYFTVSANSNLLTAHFRYGLGSSIGIHNRLRLSLGLNY
jgi:hypothetical protein